MPDVMYCSIMLLPSPKPMKTTRELMNVTHKPMNATHKPMNVTHELMNTTCEPTTQTFHDLFRLIFISIVLRHIVFIIPLLFIVPLVPLVLSYPYCSYLPLFVTTIYSPYIR